jgi:hypothetical protein
MHQFNIRFKLVCVCVCVRECMCVCVRMYVCMCDVFMCVSTRVNESVRL